MNEFMKQFEERSETLTPLQQYEFCHYIANKLNLILGYTDQEILLKIEIRDEMVRRINKIVPLFSLKLN